MVNKDEVINFISVLSWEIAPATVPHKLACIVCCCYLLCIIAALQHIKLKILNWYYCEDNYCPQR